jgi:hypothetical protein
MLVLQIKFMKSSDAFTAQSNIRFREGACQVVVVNSTFREVLLQVLLQVSLQVLLQVLLQVSLQVLLHVFPVSPSTNATHYSA